MAKKSEYTVRVAAKEGWQAIRKNLISLMVAFLSTVFLSFFIVLLLVGIAFVIFLQFDEFNALALALSAVGIAVAVVVVFLLQAFISNVTSLAFRDGLQGNKSDVGNLLKGAFKAMTRVAKTYLIMLLVILGPLLLVGLLSALLSINGFNGPKIAIAIIGLVAWTCWAILAGLRYALAPLVSLFEPSVKPMDTLARSYHLVKAGGMWFLIKGIFTLVVLNILFSVLTGNTDSTAVNSSENIAMGIWSFIVNVVSLAVSLVAQAAFVAFYFNRAKARP